MSLFLYHGRSCKGFSTYKAISLTYTYSLFLELFCIL